MRRHGQDIDDRALGPPTAHDRGSILDEEKRRAKIDRHHALEHVRRSVRDGAAIGDTSSVHQYVNPAEGAIGGGDDGPRLVEVAKVRPHKVRAATHPIEVRRDRLTAPDASPAARYARGA